MPEGFSKSPTPDSELFNPSFETDPLSSELTDLPDKVFDLSSKPFDPFSDLSDDSCEWSMHLGTCPSATILGAGGSGGCLSPLVDGFCRISLFSPLCRAGGGQLGVLDSVQGETTGAFVCSGVDTHF